MSKPITCIRLFAEQNGESRLEDIDFEITSVNYAPPAPPLGLSEPVEATRFRFFRFPEGWFDTARPSPRRQIFFMLEGEVEVWTSCGDKRTLKPEDRLLMEDTTGKGHGARPVHGEPFGVMVALE